MLMSSAALTGPNACFVRKIQAKCPANSKQSNRGAGDVKLHKDLQCFSAAGELHFELAKLDEGEGIAETLLKHNGSCINHAAFSTIQLNLRGLWRGKER